MNLVWFLHSFTAQSKVKCAQASIFKIVVICAIMMIKNEERRYTGFMWFNGVLTSKGMTTQTFTITKIELH